MRLQIQQKNLYFRRAWLAIAVLVFSVLQNTTGMFPAIFGVKALLLIPVVVAIAMYERDVAGIFYGLFAGALWDVFAAGNNFNAIYLVIIGYFSGVLINTLMRSNFATHAILSGGFSLIYAVIYWLYHYVIIDLDKAPTMLFRYYITAVIYTVVLSPLIFYIIRAIEKHYKTEMY